MKRSLWIKVILFAAFLVVGVVLLYPTIQLWTTPDLTEDERIELEKHSLHLGLDIVGGMHLVLEADTSGRGYGAADVASATDNAVRIIRKRVDDLGVSEPSIQKVGKNRIQVQLPGIADRARALDILGKTGLLEFRMLADPAATAAVYKSMNSLLSGDTTNAQTPLSKYFIAVEGDTGILDRDYKDVKELILKAKGVVPSDVEVLFGPDEDVGNQKVRRLYIVKKQVAITGGDISEKDVQAQLYQGREPGLAGSWTVEMGLKRSGQYRFAEITGSNVGKRLAIVLDGIVMSAPVIKERIPAGSKPVITTQDREGTEARDLANVIRHGALPVPLRIAEERTVSPTLGRDSVNAGVLALLVGFAAVILFMMIYYTGAGLASVVSLILNIFGLMAVLAGIRATITLPGIAGIALTIGMAVDANVLIFERIRDELRMGKFTRTAVEAGYHSAWYVILDSNITTILMAAILFIINSGPVRGFAITLSIGLLINMVTAVYFSRGIFDLYLAKNPARKLYI